MIPEAETSRRHPIAPSPHLGAPIKMQRLDSHGIPRNKIRKQSNAQDSRDLPPFPRMLWE